MMYVIICSSRAFVWTSEEIKENTEQKSRSVPCVEGRERLGSCKFLHAVKLNSGKLLEEAY